MLEKPNPKRPASHRWAIGVFAFWGLTLLLVTFNAGAGRVGSGASQYYILLFICVLGTAGLLLLLLGGRQQWVYYVVATFLGLFSLRVIYTSLWVLYFFFTRRPSTQLYYHFARQDQPFVVRQQSTALREIATLVCAALLVLLFYRFTFGRPSRRYFGFADKTEEPAPPVLPGTPPSIDKIP